MAKDDPPKPVVSALKGGRRGKLLMDPKMLTDIELLAQLHCTTEEAASYLRVAHAAFLKFLKDPRVRTVWEDGRRRGDVAHRVAMAKLGEKNASIALFLEKRRGEPPSGLKPSKGGAPEKYKPEFVRIAQKACELGATDREVGDILGVTERTITNWRLKYPAFAAATVVGKQVADQRVIQSLYRRAIGYSYDAIKVMMPAGADQPLRVDYVEHIPPDVTAEIFWLKNRLPAEWRDRHEIGGKDGGAIPVRLESLTSAQLAAFAGRLDAEIAQSESGSDPAGEKPEKG